MYVLLLNSLFSPSSWNDKKIIFGEKQTNDDL